jgi:secreted trypsin-like serine protease
MLKTSSFVLVTMTLAALGAAACTSTSAAPATGSGEIIGGIPVTSPKLDAVGSLQIDLGGPTKQAFCTGTLISATTVLTAKHCAKIQLEDGSWHYFTEFGPVYFAIGSDALAPTKLVQAQRALGTDLGEGSVMGSDVAIYSLSEPINDVKPIPVGPNLTEAEVGASFVAIGYGVQDTVGTAGKRTMGNITMSLREGQPWKTAYGSFDAFKAFLEEMNERPLTPEEIPAAQQMFEETLLPTYEAFFGAKEGDVQACSGDSGGPLLRKVGDTLTVHGVASWVPQKFKTNQLCARGVVYATFGASAADLIARAPCNAEPVEGRCDGNTVVRCAKASEGGPRVTKTRCEELDLVCSVAPDGRAGCSEPIATPPPAPPVP